mmetsp:Transcript_3352/g.5997  ORF Transcript_3352/g.5997 Transcript_3352/m.5997 type:complete len:248 (-) Transcript_3352:74-817(-)
MVLPCERRRSISVLAALPDTCQSSPEAAVGEPHSAESGESKIGAFSEKRAKEADNVVDTIDIADTADAADVVSESGETEKAFSLSDWREVNELIDVELDDGDVAASHTSPVRDDLPATVVLEDTLAAELPIEIEESAPQVGGLDGTDVSTFGELDPDLSLPWDFLGGQEADGKQQCAAAAASAAGQDVLPDQPVSNILADTFPDSGRGGVTCSTAKRHAGPVKDDAFMLEFKRRRLFYMERDKRCFI